MIPEAKVAYNSTDEGYQNTAATQTCCGRYRGGQVIALMDRCKQKKKRNARKCGMSFRTSSPGGDGRKKEGAPHIHCLPNEKRWVGRARDIGCGEGLL